MEGRIHNRARGAPIRDATRASRPLDNQGRKGFQAFNTRHASPRLPRAFSTTKHRAQLFPGLAGRSMPAPSTPGTQDVCGPQTRGSPPHPHTFLKRAGLPCHANAEFSSTRACSALIPLLAVAAAGAVRPYNSSEGLPAFEDVSEGKERYFPLRYLGTGQGLAPSGQEKS